MILSLSALICVLTFILSFYFLWIYFVTSADGSEFITFRSFFLSAFKARNFPLTTAVVASHTFCSVGVYYSIQNIFEFSL